MGADAHGEGLSANCPVEENYRAVCGIGGQMSDQRSTIVIRTVRQALAVENMRRELSAGLSPRQTCVENILSPKPALRLGSVANPYSR